MATKKRLRIALIGYGVLVIGLIDNLLRPVLIGNDAHMPHYAVMITTLGALSRCRTKTDCRMPCAKSRALSPTSSRPTRPSKPSIC